LEILLYPKQVPSVLQLPDPFWCARNFTDFLAFDPPNTANKDAEQDGKLSNCSSAKPSKKRLRDLVSSFQKEKDQGETAYYGKPECQYEEPTYYQPNFEPIF
jgi:hypothetical protein